MSDDVTTYRPIHIECRLTRTEAEWLRDSLGDTCPALREALDVSLEVVPAVDFPPGWSALVVGLGEKS